MPLKSSLYLKSATARWPRKQKRREPLSVNMISLPLGDFRHLSHIGLDAHGDAFGDLSFLKRGNSLPPRASFSEQDLRPGGTPPPPKPPRLIPDAVDVPGQDVGHHVNQRHKKCHSMPLLDSVEADERLAVETLPSVTSSGDTGLAQDPQSHHETEGAEDDCPFSLSLDLGPSILDDVLQVMDKLSH
ncbi:cdc42 effector protein 2-like [Megalops cyprinoides]|uniref:cdc42 effector protein 2-like n=1 Tax=Megalops cyprinoides TaxID=118141 RepID=UPI001863C27A|nr:cdc42 effector protein 2-like [Megalops cyprinoides]